MTINEGGGNNIDANFQQVLDGVLAKGPSADHHIQAQDTSVGVSQTIFNTLTPQSTEQFAQLLGIPFPRTVNSTPLDIDLSKL